VDLALWRNIAVLFLIFIAFVFSLPPLVILFFAVRGLGQLQTRLRDVFPPLQKRVKRAERVTAMGSKVLVTPPIQVISLTSGVLRGLRALGRRGRP